MLRRGLATGVAVAALLVLATALRADVLHMKDGTRIGGEVLSESKRLVRIKMTDGRIRAFKVDDIEKIEKGVDLADDVDRAERDGDFMPGFDIEQRKAVRKAAARVEGPMGIKLDAAARRHAWVFGDHPQHELLDVANAVEDTVIDFTEVFGCKIEDALHGARYEPAVFHVFQFQEEPAYLRYIDKVFRRERDETVNDARLDLMRRQKGFWVISPRPIMARYRGPGLLDTVVSNASHQASHAMLLMYRPSGEWMPWWFLEGFASWQEIRLTGGNRTYCIEVARPDEYAKEGTPEADESAKIPDDVKWKKDVRDMIRRSDDKTFGMLAKLSLNEIEFEDVQQSWSVVNWLAEQEKLVAFTHAYKETRTIDGACEEALSTSAPTAHQAWRAWASRP